MLKRKMLARDWLLIAILFLFCSALIGVVMRIAFVIDLPDFILFTNVKHAHSHTALFGWLFLSLSVLVLHTYGLFNRGYNLPLALVSFAVLGMFISFLTTGYSIYSNMLNALFIVGAIWLVMRILIDLKKIDSHFGIIFLKTSFFLFIVSSLAPLLLVPMVLTDLKGSAIYYACIQFFLHFQFNGWLIFVSFALILQWLANKNVKLSLSNLQRIYWLLISSCILTYALSITWSTPVKFIFWINSFGIALQCIALIYIFKFIRSIKQHFQTSHKAVPILLLLSCASFFLKVMIQALVIIPAVASVSYMIRNFVMGFFHLLLIGALTTFILAFTLLFSKQQLAAKRSDYMLFIAGFLLSEILLFTQGLLFWLGWDFMPHYYLMLAVASLLIPAGIGWIGYRMIKNKNLLLAYDPFQGNVVP